jgi:hypothetical protein
MAHLKKSSSTGHLLKNSDGHLVNGWSDCAEGCKQCCGCCFSEDSQVVYVVDVVECYWIDPDPDFENDPPSEKSSYRWTATKPCTVHLTYVEWNDEFGMGGKQLYDGSPTSCDWEDPSSGSSVYNISSYSVQYLCDSGRWQLSSGNIDGTGGCAGFSGSGWSSFVDHPYSGWTRMVKRRVTSIEVIDNDDCMAV